MVRELIFFVDFRKEICGWTFLETGHKIALEEIF